MMALIGARRLAAELRLSPTVLRRHGIAVNADGDCRSAAELPAIPTSTWRGWRRFGLNSARSSPAIAEH
jgi:hypothetical protein